MRSNKGATMAKRKLWTEDNLKELKKLKEGGSSWSDIATKLGYSRGGTMQAYSKYVYGKKAPKAKNLSAPKPMIFEVPDAPRGQVAILIVPMNQVKEVMASLWQ
jgi:hypothetical protein